MSHEAWRSVLREGFALLFVAALFVAWCAK
jgi:hypothetical protein